MQSKYHMTVEQNVFVAKRNIVDYIWKSAHLEGLAVTYPDTEAYFNAECRRSVGQGHHRGQQSKACMAVCAG